MKRMKTIRTFFLGYVLFALGCSAAQAATEQVLWNFNPPAEPGPEFSVLRLIDP